MSCFAAYQVSTTICTLVRQLTHMDSQRVTKFITPRTSLIYTHNKPMSSKYTLFLLQNCERSRLQTRLEFLAHPVYKYNFHYNTHKYYLSSPPYRPITVLSLHDCLLLLCILLHYR